MTRAMGCRPWAGLAVSLCLLVPPTLEAQQVYELSPDTFICQERQHFIIYDQLMEVGDTRAAREYSRGRCLYLATELRFDWIYGDLQDMEPERRLVVEAFIEQARLSDAYWPSDRSVYVLIEDRRFPPVSLDGQPREWTRPDPMESTFVEIKTIDGEPLFQHCPACAVWVRTADLTPLR